MHGRQVIYGVVMGCLLVGSIDHIRVQESSFSECVMDAALLVMMMSSYHP